MHPLTWSWEAWGLGTMLMMLVFWGLVVVGIMFAIRWSTETNSRRRSGIFADASSAAVGPRRLT